jgi:hypothetical protein
MLGARQVGDVLNSVVGGMEMILAVVGVGRKDERCRINTCK